MVKKIAILVIGIVAVLLIVAALRVTRRCGDNDRITPEMSSAIVTALPSLKEPLTDLFGEEFYRDLCAAAEYVIASEEK